MVDYLGLGWIQLCLSNSTCPSWLRVNLQKSSIDWMYSFILSLYYCRGYFSLKIIALFGNLGFNWWVHRLINSFILSQAIEIFQNLKMWTSVVYSLLIKFNWNYLGHHQIHFWWYITTRLAIRSLSHSRRVLISLSNYSRLS